MGLILIASNIMSPLKIAPRRCCL